MGQWREGVAVDAAEDDQVDTRPERVGEGECSESYGDVAEVMQRDRGSEPERQLRGLGTSQLGGQAFSGLAAYPAAISKT